jgi:hypothetical protein
MRQLTTLALAAALLAPAAIPGAPPVAVTVRTNSTVVERFMGAGVQWDPYEYPPSPEDWTTTLHRVDFMQPGYLRVMWNASAYLRGFDAAGNPRYVWSEGETGMDRLHWLLAILDYAQSHHIDVLIGEWSPSRGLNVAGERVGAADPHWAKVHAGFLKYLLGVRQYTVIKYFNYMNEPNGNWMWPGGKVDYDAWAQGISNLRKELDAQGLGGVRIAGPDNSGNWEWLDRSAADLGREFGAWEMHWYAKDSDVLDGKIEQLLTEKREMLGKADPQAASKPLFIGESGMIEGKTNGDQQPRVKEFAYGVLMADYFAQVARAGWQGATAWDLDDALHVNTGGHVTPPTARTLKIWGFWNTQGAVMGHPEDEAIRPWFYTWSLMARLFPVGARIVAAESGPGVRALAALREGALSVMLVNDSDAKHTVTMRVPGGGRHAIAMYRYFDKDRPATAEGFPAVSRELPVTDLTKGLRIELPSRGVVFLTTAAPAP